jgi:NTE family protein
MKSSSIEEIIAAQNQPFKCASFSGGGAKGAIYSGAHEALSKGGVLKNLDAVAGSSAGSLTAAMIATGISTEKYKQITKDTNLKGLLGEGFLVNKDGKPLLNLLKNTIRSNISEFLENADISNLCNQRLEQIDKQKLAAESLPQSEKEETLSELTRQEDVLLNIISSNGKLIEEIKEKALDPEGKILFKDLAMLRVIAPDTFKDLVVTATRKDTGDLEIFDSRNTPDVEIALACRASASIPIVFEPVTINGKQYVDGGYRDNLPLSHFNEENANGPKDISDNPEEIQSAKKTGRTLALAFGSGMDDSANVAIYSAQEKIVNPGKLVKFLMDVVFKALARVGGIFKYSEEENKTFERVRENALNTVVLDTGDVGTLSFDLAQEKAEYLHIKGFMQTSRYLDNHDIAPIKDPNFEMKDFFLKVYEDSQAKSTIQSWKDKVVGGKTEKLKVLLEFCKDEPWQNKSKEEVLSDVITISATARTSGKVTADTNTIKALTNALNDSFTPETVRLDFVKTLGIDVQKDKRFDNTKTLSQNMAKFKFEDNDFKEFLKNKQANNTREEPKSMSEKIKEQQAQNANKPREV